MVRKVLILFLVLLLLLEVVAVVDTEHKPMMVAQVVVQVQMIQA